MLEWTGERFVPWARDATLAYEHLHRYLWASHLVRGKRVLDLACGEGYGASILAEDAASVCAVDIDDQAVDHASEKYRQANLRFLRADVTDLPITDDHSFDVIVCFEAIEHIEQQEKLIGEVVRLLEHDGLFIISTPNKDNYRTGAEGPNPFHVKELSFGEFDTLLSQRFAHIRYFGQQVHSGSWLWPIDGEASTGEDFAIARAGQEFRRLQPSERAPKYLVAVASNGQVEAIGGGVLMDDSDELIAEKNRERELVQEKVDQRDEALAWRAEQVEVLEREKMELLAGIELLQKDTAVLRNELAKIHGSRSWRLITKLRSLLGR
jgi:ubiquinone/menaquinone biosynthesis C-methylase UbiE